MAGIGFELKRLFKRKGLFATMRAYGYAGIVCTGPCCWVCCCRWAS